MPIANRQDDNAWGPPTGWQPRRVPRDPRARPLSHLRRRGHRRSRGKRRSTLPKSAVGTAPADRVLRRPHQGRRPGARTRAARPRLALALYRATFGLVNVGQSPEEIRQAELEARIKAVLRGHYKVGVMGKGGVGKTTVSASVGSVFAELRQDDRVVAIDADTAFGKLGSRVDPKAKGSYWELASDQHLETFADVRSRVGNNAAGLFVSPARRARPPPGPGPRDLSGGDRAAGPLLHHLDHRLQFDHGHPVTQEVLRDLDALIVVSSPWVDGAAAAGQTMDWLAARGLTGLLQRTVVVLNDSDGHADKRTRGILAQQFASQGQVVVEVPFDGHLRPGGVIDRTTEMSPATRRKFIEIAAALAEYFPTRDDRSRERY